MYGCNPVGFAGTLAVPILINLASSLRYSRGRRTDRDANPCQSGRQKLLLGRRELLGAKEAATMELAQTMQGVDEPWAPLGHKRRRRLGGLCRRGRCRHCRTAATSHGHLAEAVSRRCPTLARTRALEPDRRWRARQALPNSTR